VSNLALELNGERRTRTIHGHSAPKCSKGLRCLCRKPFAFNHELVAGARYVPNLDTLCILFRSELIHCAA